MGYTTLRKYATTLDDSTVGSRKISFLPYKVGLNTFATSSDWTPAAADFKVCKAVTGSGLGSEASIGTAPTWVNGRVVIILSNTELTCRYLTIRIENAAINSDEIIVETYGNASASYQVDYSSATVAADLKTWNGSANPVTYLASIYNSYLLPTATATGTSTSRTFTVDSALANASADLVGGLLYKTSGKPFVRRITAYSAGVVSWANAVSGQPALDGSEVYLIIPASEVEAGTDARVKVTADAHTSGETVAAVTGAVGSVTGLTNATISAAVWDYLTSAASTVGSFGKKLKDWTLGSDSKAMLSTDAQTGVVLPRVTLTDTLTTYTGNTVQTGDAYARLGAPAGASHAADVAAVKADTASLLARVTSTLFTGITSLAQWLGLLAGKQTGNTTARTEIRATGGGSGTFDETTDSQEAIRDRGDAAWTTGAGSSLTTADIADAVWDEPLSGHATAGSAGAQLTSAGGGATTENITVSFTEARGS